MLEPLRSAHTSARIATRRTRFPHLFALRAMAALGVALLVALMPLPALAASASSRASSGAVVDYSSGFGASTPATLRSAGVGIVIRYVGSSAWKCLTPAEAAALQRSGIDIAAVYESSAGWMLAGRSAGIAAAQAARAAVIADGGPTRPFIYFACDMETSDFADVNAALQGAQSVLGAENVGIYGNYAVCSEALKAGAAAKAWQTVAWSHGQVLSGATLIQLVPQTLGNLGVDYDTDLRYAADIGQWGVGVRSNDLAGLPGAAVSASQAPAVPEVATFTVQSAPTTVTLRAVESTDGVSAWAVGDAGTILHTESADSTWTVQSTPTSASLSAVDFYGRSGWAAGENGTIFHTADGGHIWDGQSTPTTVTLTAISFADSVNGWAVGERGTVLRTRDGGVTWAKQSVPATVTLDAVAFSSETTGVAFGERGAFLFTNNGGASWFEHSMPTISTLSAYSEVSSTTAWSVGTSGTVLYTGSVGATWGVQSAPTTSTLNDVVFADPAHGMAVGASSTVLFTQDAGQTWAAQSVPSTGTLNAVKLIGSKGWVVGENGTLLRLRLVKAR